MNTACLVVYAPFMKESSPANPNFAAVPSAPKANRLLRLLVLLLLLILAVASIWWIDKGAWGK